LAILGNLTRVPLKDDEGLYGFDTGVEAIRTFENIFKTCKTEKKGLV